MKLLLGQIPNQARDRNLHAVNDLLLLAMELLEYDGTLPVIDMTGAHISHWNGQRISIDRREVGDLIDRGLLDRDGCWTAYGRAYLLRETAEIGKAS